MLFYKNIEPYCVYCRYGTSMGGNEVICIKRGVMANTGSCGAFIYEPTKREPETYPVLNITGLKAEDFEL